MKLLVSAGARKVRASSLSNAKQKGYTEIVELLGSVELSVVQDYEVLAISSVRDIVTSQNTYSTTLGSGNYATDLEALGEGRESRTLQSIIHSLIFWPIDSVLVSGTKKGYAFSTSGDADTFTASARPLTYGSTGTRSFFSDESGVIRYTREDRPATADDPPIGP